MGESSGTRLAVPALEWLDAGRAVAGIVLVEARGSAPFDPGASMLVDDRGRIEGSVTGGCIEAELVEHAGEVLAGGDPRVVRFGVSDEIAGAASLMCGGVVDVFVYDIGRRGRDAARCLATALGRREPAALALVLDGPTAGAKIAVLPDGDVVGSLGRSEAFDALVAKDAVGLLAAGGTAVRRYGASDELAGADLRVFIQAFSAPPQLVIMGAIDFSASVAAIATELGYRVTICDAREQFVRSGRFARHAEVVVDWPDRHLRSRRLGPRDAVLVFTHDPKFDEPALVAALETPVGYIGALGSRRTQDQRRERLLELGVGEDDLARISGPCGLDIGAQTPAETAISIMAEMIARRNRKLGKPLTETSGPIRRGDATASA